MPEIMIEQSTFERLQRHATPLVDNTDTIINRALDALEQHKEHTAQKEDYAVPEREIDLHRLPSVKHTKILDASIGGKPIDKPKWNLLVKWMLVDCNR